MLWQRVLTALVLMPLVIAGILFLDTNWVAALLAVVLLVGAREMANLANIRTSTGQVGFIIGVAVVMAFTWLLIQAGYLVSLQVGMAIWWVGVTALLVLRRSDLHKVTDARPFVLLIGALILATAWASVVSLHASIPNGPWLVLLLFTIIWAADSGAYFAGRAFGKRKLSPFVSPGKTWAGVAGAICLVSIALLGLSLGGWMDRASPLPLLLLGIVVTLVSIGGDLWESRLKREAGAKDSGSLLPGHGGMLDRIDSLLAAAPVFGLGLGIIGVAA
jgi:phosphatidate cytidylyltransferase